MMEDLTRARIVTLALERITMCAAHEVVGYALALFLVCGSVAIITWVWWFLKGG